MHSSELHIQLECSGFKHITASVTLDYMLII